MKAWDVTEENIREAAAEVGLRIFGWPEGSIEKDGCALRFRLAVNIASPRDVNGFLPFQRCSTLQVEKPRKIAAVCWHGHREFMRALFARVPSARIKTALADYRGSEDFERTHRRTQGTGNAFNLSYEQACGCSLERG